jgi:hypothetical protein
MKESINRVWNNVKTFLMGLTPEFLFEACSKQPAEDLIGI